jgi:acetate kinase
MSRERNDLAMKVLVINSGSSSIKYRIFDMSDSSALASGLLEQIGEPMSRLGHRWRNASGEMEEALHKRPVSNHKEGLDWIINMTSGYGVLSGDLFGVGHRVVHGGEEFHEPALIDDGVVAAIREMVPLAPLHNPASLMGIEVALELCPGVPQVAVFDTAFHHSMPPCAFRYAIPNEMYRAHHIRRYGFHGTSHQYVAARAAELMGRPLSELNLITFHLGNGASAAAIKEGKSMDTSMGMTPLEGLMMGTRSGDLDPAIHLYMARTTGKSIDEIEALLYRESGLRGICGVNDMREVVRRAEGGDELATLAIDMYCYRIKKYMGAYFAALGRVDAIVFTAGVGENSALIRKRSLEGLVGMGISLDDQKNRTASGGVFEIQDAESKVSIFVIPTNEELEIARQTLERIRSGKL